MEASDAFGTEIASGEDPFAGGEDWAGFGGDAEKAQAATSELPTVDKEGNPVAAEETTPSDGRSELERREDAYQYAVSHGEPVSEELSEAHQAFVRTQSEGAQDAEFEAAAPAPPEPAPQTPEQQQAQAAAQHNEQQAATDAQEAADAAERAVEEVQAAEAERETAEGRQEAAESQPEPQADPEEPQAVAEEPQAVAEPDPDPEPEAEAPVPEERQSPGGKTTHRRYYVLRVSGPGKFEQVTWFEDKQGKMVAKGTPGAKRQGVALCRGTDDALRKGHAALGSPTEVVKLVAVAALHFQPKNLEPDVPEPSRVRLKIG